MIAIAVTALWMRESELAPSHVSPGLNIVVGLAYGLKRATLVMAVVAAVAYAVITTALMVVAARRCWGPVLMHGGAGLAIAAILLAKARSSEHERAAQLQADARAEAARVAEKDRLRHCLRVDRPRIFFGKPLRVHVTLRNSDCPELEIDQVSVEGRREWAGHAMVNHFPEPAIRLPPGGVREVALVDDDALESADGWAWSVLVGVRKPTLLDLLYCGPGAQSPHEAYRPCRPLEAPELVAAPK